jgi:hypothetical protein
MRITRCASFVVNRMGCCRGRRSSSLVPTEVEIPSEQTGITTKRSAQPISLFERDDPDRAARTRQPCGRQVDQSTAANRSSPNPKQTSPWPASARTTCSSPMTGWCWAGSTWCSSMTGSRSWVTASPSMSPAVELRRRRCATSACWLLRDTGSAPSEPPLTAATWHPSECCSTLGSFPSGKPIQQTLAGNMAPGISGTSLSGQRVTPETALAQTHEGRRPGRVQRCVYPPCIGVRIFR